MRHFLLPATLLLALLTGRAAAQAAPPPPPPRPDAPALAAPAAPTDTAAALHRLFAERRQRRNIVVGVTGVLTVVPIIGAASESHSGSDFSGVAEAAFGITGGLVVASELLFFRKYSRKKERRAVESFQAHRLDRDLRRKLKPRYFR